MIRIPLEHNIYTNPLYYFDKASDNLNFNQWLDTKIFPDNLDKINIQFPIINNHFYLNYWTETPIETHRDLLFSIYDFYFKCEIDQDYAGEHNLPIQSGYWFFYLDITGCYLDGFDKIDKNTLKIYTKSLQSIPNVSIPIPNIVVKNIQTDKSIKEKSYLCKKCYYLNVIERTKCPRCKTVLTKENRKY